MSPRRIVHIAPTLKEILQEDNRWESLQSCLQNHRRYLREYKQVRKKKSSKSS